MLHYHGTPITPRSQLLRMAGRCFCVSYASPRDAETCIQIGQSVMFDNGAFTAFTHKQPFNETGFYRWLSPLLAHPHWGVIPDVIDGTVEEQKLRVSRWPFPKELGAPVWHLGLPIDYLLELADSWPRICFGSSAAYWKIGSELWQTRMDEAFDALSAQRVHLPWIHGLRMLAMGKSRWPLASADSTNIARNHHELGCAKCLAERVDEDQPPLRWRGK